MRSNCHNTTIPQQQHYAPVIPTICLDVHDCFGQCGAFCGCLAAAAATTKTAADNDSVLLQDHGISIWDEWSGQTWILGGTNENSYIWHKHYPPLASAVLPPVTNKNNNEILTLRHVKKAIQSLKGIPVERQQLFFGAGMEDDTDAITASPPPLLETHDSACLSEYLYASENRLTGRTRWYVRCSGGGAAANKSRRAALFSLKRSITTAPTPTTIPRSIHNYLLQQQQQRDQRQQQQQNKIQELHRQEQQQQQTEPALQIEQQLQQENQNRPFVLLSSLLSSLPSCSNDDDVDVTNALFPILQQQHQQQQSNERCNNHNHSNQNDINSKNDQPFLFAILVHDIVTNDIHTSCRHNRICRSFNNNNNNNQERQQQNDEDEENYDNSDNNQLYEYQYLSRLQASDLNNVFERVRADPSWWAQQSLLKQQQ